MIILLKVDKTLRKLKIVEDKMAKLEAEKKELVAPITERLSGLKIKADIMRDEILDFLVDENDGEMLEVKGVGTASVVNKLNSIEVTNDATAIKFAKKYKPDMVKTQETLNKADYKKFALKYLEKKGKMLPGTETFDKQTVSIRFEKGVK